MKAHHPKVNVIPQEIVERGLALVQTAHQLRLNHQVNVFHKKLRTNAGNYSQSRINIDSTIPSSAFTFIHELGHHLDYEELATSFHKPCSTMHQSPLSRLVKIMRASKSYQCIRNDRSLSKYKRRYYSKAVELWARAYTQFVIRRCISAGLGMNDMPVLSYQWDDEDFEPIYAEILAIFSAKGWI